MSMRAFMLMFLESLLPSHPSTISLTANLLTLLLFLAIASPPYNGIDNNSYQDYLHEPCRREKEEGLLS